MWGVRFVANDKSLISFSLISSMWGKYKKDSIDMLIPFVLYSFSELDDNNSIVSVIDTKEFVEKEFGLKILSNIIEIIFKRLSKEEYRILIRDKKRYLLADRKPDVSEFKLQRDNNKKSNYIVQQEFYKFLDLKNITYDQNVANNALISYLCNYGRNIIADNIAILENGDIWNHRVGEFIQSISKDNELIFDYVKNIAKGGMIASIIFNNSTKNYRSNKKFKNTTIYYDTSLLMHLLGYSGRALYESISELTDLLQKQNAKICYFRHNLKELEGILNAYIRVYNLGKLNESYNFDYFIENEITPETISEYIVLLEKNLESKGLSVEDTPSYQNIAGNIDWEKFDKYLEKNIKYLNPNRRKNDVESLAAIYRLRTYSKYTNYESCHALFVTTNPSLVYHAKKYFRLDEERTGIPAIVDDTFLTGFIWLKNENIYEQLPTLKIIADALSSQTLSAEFWNLFLDKVDTYEKQNIITFEEAARLKVDIFTKKNIYDLTDGDIDKLDHGTMKELLKRNDMERHQALLEENDKLSSNIRKQDNTILELSNKIVDSRVQYYLSQKMKMWRFIIVAGKSWLFILCVTLVILTKLFDFLLTIGNSVFVNISSISIVFSIILKFIDKKLSSYNKGVEYWFYKKSYNNLKNLVKQSEQEYCDEIISKIKEKIKEFKLLPE